MHSHSEKGALLAAASVSLLANVIRKLLWKGGPDGVHASPPTVTQNTLGKHPLLMRHVAYSEYIILAESFYLTILLSNYRVVCWGVEQKTRNKKKHRKLPKIKKSFTVLVKSFHIDSCHYFLHFKSNYHVWIFVLLQKSVSKWMNCTHHHLRKQQTEREQRETWVRGCPHDLPRRDKRLEIAASLQASHQSLLRCVPLWFLSESVCVCYWGRVGSWVLTQGH